MTLEQLHIFVGVADREHMTKAAIALNITQSTASAAIAALEMQYGVPLFHRIGRRIKLTDAGRVFLAEAKAVLGRAASAERVLSEFSLLKRGRLTLVASQTIANYWLPEHLAIFRKRHPQITVDVAIANTEQATHSILSGIAELGFVEGTVTEASIEHWPIAHDQLVLVSSDPPTTIDDAWIRSAHWIMREHGSGTRSTLESALRQRGIDPERLHVLLTLPSNESVRTAVEAGAGVTVLSAFVVARAVRTGALHILPLELPTRPFLMLRHKERYQSKATYALIECINETKY